MSLSTDTVRIPRPVLLPPVAADRRDKLRLTRRGRAIRDTFAGLGLGAIVLSFDTITHAVAEFVVAIGPYIPGSVL